MSQVLYRKYRPKTFSDVVGQEHITSVLLNEIKENKVAHAYLFTGSRGTGKTTCSKILAKAVNCLNPIDGNPCGKCEICRAVEDGSQFDIVELDAASNNSVEDVRVLRQEAVYAPSSCKYRVYIIDEAHMLSVSAFNALLKIMEEPPEHVIFIMATTEAHKIPATILSRCQIFEFKRFSAENIADRLNYIAMNEGFSLDREAALLIAKLAKGGMRDAISLLDVCSSKDSHITEEIVSSTAGLAKNETVYTMAEHIAEKNFALLFSDLDMAYEGTSDPQRICQQLIEHFRQIMLFKASGKQDEFSADSYAFDKAKEQSEIFGMNSILNILKELQNALSAMTNSPNKALCLEIALIKLSAYTENNDNLIKRIEILERKVEKLINEGVTVLPKAEDTSAKVVKVEPQIKKDAVPLKQWNEIMGILEKSNPPLHGSLNGSKAYTCGNILLVECENDLFLTLVRKNELSRNSLRDAAEEITGKVYKLGPFKKDEYNISEKIDPLDEFINKLDPTMYGLELN